MIVSVYELIRLLEAGLVLRSPNQHCGDFYMRTKNGQKQLVMVFGPLGDERDGLGEKPHQRKAIVPFDDFAQIITAILGTGIEIPMNVLRKRKKRDA